MNGRITEHIFYSFRPKLSAKATQSIRKARRRFLSVPRRNPEGSCSGFLSQIPQPHHRIQNQAQCRGSLRPLPFVRLRLLAAQTLLGVLEGVLDGPSVVVPFQNLGGGHRHIGRKQKIVSFFAGRVSADHKQDRLMRNPVPEDWTGIHPSLYRLAPLTKLDLFPVVNIRRHLLWAGKPLAFLSGPASGFLSSLGRKIEDLCIALDSRNQMGLRHLFSCQRCVKAVGHQSKPPLGQPLLELIYHLHRQFDQGSAVFSMQPHVDWQSQRLAAPGGLNLQGQNHQVQSPGIDKCLLCRADGISPVPGALDLPAAVMEQGIVQSHRKNPLGTKEVDQHPRQYPPEPVEVPAGIRKKPMVGVVSPPKAGISKGQDAGDRSSGRAQNPPGSQTRENGGSRRGENWKKLLDYIRPGRNTHWDIHSNLRVVTFPLLLSDGCYFYDDNPWPTAA